MVYALLRAIAGIALRWYYRDIQVEGLEHVPRQRPVLLAVNHPNALVDVLLVAWIVPRRILVTAKSTIFEKPIAAMLLRWLGVVPLYRTSDVAASDKPDPSRNRDTFRAVIHALGNGGAVLIFPEGKTHDEPSLAPLKTGAARMALDARNEGRARGLAVLPIGLTFERKEAPRSRVLVQVGEPIIMDAWEPASNTATPVEALTSEIDTRLRAVTVNYATVDDATRAVRLSSMIAALLEDVPRIGAVDRNLGSEIMIARRIEALSARLPSADATVHARADQLIRRLDATSRVAAKHGVLVEDVRIAMDRRHAARFTVRESWLLLIGGPLAVWGRLNHWLPFHAARVVAMASVDSAADPAMRTVVAGAGFVLLAYLAQTAVVGMLWGPVVAGVYLVSLPIAADINFLLSERLHRALRRARAYLLFRRDPLLRERLSAELDLLRTEVLAFERALGEQNISTPM
jgi:glycerol-3-phosphate O-acyltransferase / dihydroxyacetone phosphate acyltransferase